MKNDKIMKTKRQHQGNGVGRPKVKIDEKILGNLAHIGCTLEECGDVLGVSARTLQRNFADLIHSHKNKGKASLRKKMYEKAVTKDNTYMQIWLSKNYLGMKDRTVNEQIAEPIPLIIEAEDVKDLNGKKG
jgi:hypothetical protein|tara:strand:+ start:100 stop:492 length:393 start_codon:yes stop_codon:yes gene_type:complete